MRPRPPLAGAYAAAARGWSDVLAFADVAADGEGPLTVDGVARAAERRPRPFHDPERHRVRAGAGR